MALEDNFRITFEIELLFKRDLDREYPLNQNNRNKYIMW